MPLEVYVSKFSHTRFEPMGHTKNPDIRIAKSVVDYIFRFLGITFLPGYREANAGLPVETASKGGEEPEAEPMPAVKKTGGQASGSGRPTATAPAKSATVKPNGSNGQHAKGANGNATNGNGANGNGSTAKGTAVAVSLLERAGVAPKFEFRLNDNSTRGEQFATFQVDAPSCDNCGAITVRNGNCYLCHNCGNSMGCS